MYFEPDASKHEQKYGGYIVDILRGGEAVEIQTSSFYKIRGKLEKLLGLLPVTLVYPVPRHKWLLWTDPGTGEVRTKRRSPKTGNAYEVLPELYGIKSLINNPNLRVGVIMVDIEEYRRLDGWSRDRKRGSSRCERIPVAIGDYVEIRGAQDYIKLIPQSLPEKFTSADYKRESGLSLRAAQTALNVLHTAGAVEKTGRKGRSYAYVRKDFICSRT